MFTSIGTLLIYIIAINVAITSANYHIKGSNDPMYMYHTFTYSNGHIFPHDIRINVSLSTIAGTLLYSIDNHMNQLIVSLSAVGYPIICVEFRNNRDCVSLSELCQCERCRYEILDLRVQMRDVIHLQCNGGDIRFIKYGDKIEVNENYPIPFAKSNKSKSTLNEAHLWLINNPQYGHVYPNQHQMSGCIFSVTYDGVPIAFTNISDNIVRQCNAVCTDKICNGGVCYETYNRYPVCNCTTTFLNGRYCNESIVSRNIESKSNPFICDAFKLSWNGILATKDTKIMKMKNSNVDISLYSEETFLIFEYVYTNGRRIHIKSIISKNYNKNTASIFIAYFNILSMETWFFNNGASYYTAIPTNRDLSREMFHYLALQSGEGKIDFLFKVSRKDYFWKNIDFSSFVNLTDGNEFEHSTLHPNNNTTTSTRPKPDSVQSVATSFVVTAVINVMLTIVILSLICEVVPGSIGCVQQKTRYYKMLNTKHIKLNESDEDDSFKDLLEKVEIV